MRYIRIKDKKLEIVETDNITFDLLRAECCDSKHTLATVEKHRLHTGLNNRNLMLYLDEDAKMRGRPRNVNIFGGRDCIAGTGIIVSEKNNGAYLSLSDHELKSIKILDDELIILLPTHGGYVNNQRRPRIE